VTDQPEETAQTAHEEAADCFPALAARCNRLHPPPSFSEEAADCFPALAALIRAAHGRGAYDHHTCRSRTRRAKHPQASTPTFPLLPGDPAKPSRNVT
jgi:hypothetical protein